MFATYMTNKILVCRIRNFYQSTLKSTPGKWAKDFKKDSTKRQWLYMTTGPQSSVISDNEKNAN
jgi:hypothetical protein